MSLFLWTGVVAGILLGWFWKPRWVEQTSSSLKNWISSLPRNPVFQKWAVPLLKGCYTRFACSVFLDGTVFEDDESTISLRHSKEPITKEKPEAVSLASSVIQEEDLLDLQRRFQGRDGGLPWVLMMERSTPGFTYQAWRRDPQDGPTEYKSRTVFEDSTAELLKDFYWDDEFRAVWDDMLIYAKSLEQCMETGAEISHWVRKFPFFCSNREYVIGRRIYECEGTFFCITKAVPYDGVPRQDKPLRVDIYYSSWCIRAAESVKNPGQMTACEVTFFHGEDMHIPKSIAKFGVQQGMWGCVKKMEPGLRKYQLHRATTAMLSQNARMAQIYTRLVPDFSSTTKEDSIHAESELQHNDLGKGVTRVGQSNALKWLIIGGAVVLACTIDNGAIGKVFAFGLARRFSKMNGRF